MLAVSTGVDIEVQLEALGVRRREQRQADKTLVTEIRRAVDAARESGVSMTRVSKLLGIDRTQLYRTYLS